MDSILPKDWRIEYSKSKNQKYYYNIKTNECYWIKEELPFLWSYDYDKNDKKRYFKITDRLHSITYDVPKPSNKRKLTENDIKRNSLSNSHKKIISFTKVNQFSVQNNDQNIHFIENKKSEKLNELNEENNKISIDINKNKIISDKISKEINTNGLDKRNTELKMENNNDQIATATFYDNLKRDKKQDRLESQLYHLRNLNNFIKSILISKYTPENAKVLDLACGKGGDMHKLQKKKLKEYVGVDIAFESLRDFIDRIQENKNNYFNNIPVTLISCDLGSVYLPNDDVLTWTNIENTENNWIQKNVLKGKEESFDMISMQFALHYMFDNEKRCNLFFKNIENLLRPGGYFIATTIDSGVVMKKFLKNLGLKDTNGKSSPIKVIDNKNRLMCSITFDEETENRFFDHENKSNELPFGLRYYFKLLDTEKHGDAVDLPEYLIPKGLLNIMLEKYNLKLLYQCNFCDYLMENLKNREFQILLRKMNVLNYKGTISDAEWEISGLYNVLIIQKAFNN